MAIITKGLTMTEQKPKGIRYSENSNQATLWQFKQVIETGELRYLLILDDYDELPEFDITLLTEVWQGIYQEFSNISGGSRADLWLVKVKRLSSMQVDYQRHASMLRIVKEYPHDELIEDLTNMKMHERIDRNPRLSYKVKKILGYTCQVCGFNIYNFYGPLRSDYIECHHLVPISQLKGQVVSLDPSRDFAVLCSNCHSIIHKYNKPHDIQAFKDMVKH